MVTKENQHRAHTCCHQHNCTSSPPAEAKSETDIMEDGAIVGTVVCIFLTLIFSALSLIIYIEESWSNVNIIISGILAGGSLILTTANIITWTKTVPEARAQDQERAPNPAVNNRPRV